MIESFQDVIGLWPHRSEFADDVGVPYERAKAWWRRDRIPGDYYADVAKAARRRGFRGVTAATLIKIGRRSPLQEMERAA